MHGLFVRLLSYRIQRSSLSTFFKLEVLLDALIAFCLVCVLVFEVRVFLVLSLSFRSSKENLRLEADDASRRQGVVCKLLFSRETNLRHFSGRTPVFTIALLEG